ncbi:PA14 domain-containing protein [Marinimicrobium alkaliphilum]|uniref:PA14 domain-containing protein n=1 Tax=Marinimicrobium alkaliphilum TaxID=2202654 RepID=UPI0013005E50|nr:PA14 domain-containing protein [Marinimicrobium alkaliphilum]
MINTDQLQRWCNPNTFLSALLIVLLILAINAMIPARVDANLRLDIQKNRSAINSLNQRRDIETRQSRWVDHLDLANNGRFAHPRLGKLGFDEHFFVDIETTFVVHQAGNYEFEVASDDGFALNINGRNICSFPRPRALSSQRCRIRLDEGEQRFTLNYFQAGGQAGLSVRYGLQNQRQRYWFGEDSELLSIQR